MTIYETPDLLVDTDTTRAIKESIQLLTIPEKIIFLTYVELGSYAAVARKYKVSSQTARAYIKEIKTKITDYLNDTGLTDFEFDSGADF